MPKKFVAMMLGVVAVLSLIIVVAIPTINAEGTKELKLLYMIYRHGIRTPADTYPKDPYINDTFYPTGWGQVTNRGKFELYNHGKYLRRRYNKFLGDFYSTDIYYVQTTDVDRTRVTAQCINAGLWPPNVDQKWGPLDWQPIPTNSEPLHLDDLLLVRRPCAQYSLELERLMRTPEIQRRLQRDRQMFDEISRFSGKHMKDFEDALDIYTTLMSEEYSNLALPEWTRNYYPDRLYEPAVFAYVFNAYNDKLNRLKGGVFVKKLLKDFQDYSKGQLKPYNRKAFLYVGHDSTIANVLSTLKIWDPQIPGFAINFLIEFSLDRSNNQFGVEIFLRNGTAPDQPPHQLRIPNCDLFCPLSRLIELTRNVIPEDWDEECKSDDPNYVPPAPGGP